MPEPAIDLPQFLAAIDVIAIFGPITIGGRPGDRLYELRPFDREQLLIFGAEAREAGGGDEPRVVLAHSLVLAWTAFSEVAGDMDRPVWRAWVHPVVDDAVLDDPLHIGLGLAERDLLDPLQHVLAPAGVAVAVDPFAGVARTRVVACDRKRNV